MLNKSDKKKWSRPTIFFLPNHSVSSGATVGSGEAVTFGNSGGCGNAVMIDPGKTTTLTLNYCYGAVTGCSTIMLVFKAVGTTSSIPSIGICS